MSRLLKITALLLATLWLPATVHCQLESLGLDTLFACADSEHAGDDACADDGCQTIEVRPDHRGEVAPRCRFAGPARLLLPFLPVRNFRAATTAPEFVAARQDETLPLQRTWQFARRAALPARAPDTLKV